MVRRDAEQVVRRSRALLARRGSGCGLGWRVLSACFCLLALAAAWLVPRWAMATEWETYLSEKFDGDESMFFTGQAGEAFYSIDDQGRYIINGMDTDSDSLSAITDELYYYSTQAKCTLVSSDAENLAFVGLVFHYKKQADGNLAYYVFYVYGDGYYGAKRVIGDDVEIALPLTKSDSIMSGATNTLGVEAQGSRFDLYVNGRHVDGFTDLKLDGGGFGFYISKRSEGAFDNFTVKVEKRATGQESPEPPNAAEGEQTADSRFTKYSPPYIPKDPNRPTYPWEVGVDKTGKGKKKPAEKAPGGHEDREGGKEKADRGGVRVGTGGGESRGEEAGKGNQPPENKKSDEGVREPAKEAEQGGKTKEEPPQPPEKDNTGGNKDEQPGYEDQQAGGEQAPPGEKPAPPPGQGTGGESTSGSSNGTGNQEAPTRGGDSGTGESSGDGTPAAGSSSSRSSGGSSAAGAPPTGGSSASAPESAPQAPVGAAPLVASVPAEAPGIQAEHTSSAKDEAPPSPAATPRRASRDRASGMRGKQDDWADVNSSSPPVPEIRPPAKPPASRHEETVPPAREEKLELPVPPGAEDAAPGAADASTEGSPESGAGTETAATAQPAHGKPAQAANEGTSLGELPLLPAASRPAEPQDAAPQGAEGQGAAEQEATPPAPVESAAPSAAAPAGADSAGSEAAQTPPEGGVLDLGQYYPQLAGQELGKPESGQAGPAVQVNTGNSPEAAAPEKAQTGGQPPLAQPDRQDQALAPAPAVGGGPLAPGEPPAAEAGIVTLTDDFSEQKWPVAEAQDCTYRYFGAAYEINNLRASTMALSFQQHNLANQEVACDCEFMDGVSYVGYGVAARFSVSAGKPTYYGLFICASGEFMLLKMVAGQETVLGQWTAAAQLNPSTPNRVALSVWGNTLTALINGEQVYSVQDSGIARGGYALLVGPGVAARFDNFSLRAEQVGAAPATAQ